MAREMHPAVLCDLSARISRLDKAGPLLILSGEFGLLGSTDPIPWYDHLLLQEEVEAMVPRVTAQLRERAVAGIAFHTADPAADPAVQPYVALIIRACALAQVPLRLVVLPGSPP